MDIYCCAGMDAWKYRVLLQKYRALFRNTGLFWCRRKHTVGQICTCGNIWLFCGKQELVKHSSRALLRKSELFCETTMNPESIKDRWRRIKQSICTAGNLGKYRNKIICTNELWILRTSRIYKSPDLVFPARLFPKQKFLVDTELCCG